MKTFLDLFTKPSLIALIGDTHTGKSNMIYHTINALQHSHKFQLFVYGLRCHVKDAKEIHSIDELELIKDSVIIVDEFFSLFDLEDRKNKTKVERTLRMLFHNNNILILAGLPENFKKFISAKVHKVIYKKVTFEDFINGSSLKRNVLKYQGAERGSSILNLMQNECLVYDGKHYEKYHVPYIEDKDSKKDNVDILVPKSVPKNVEKRVKYV
ncbi:MAG: hypothetical protein ACTSU7_00100 [Candidatus Heimdallarchaeaceae archaeon]